jgi:hypothetical protein
MKLDRVLGVICIALVLWVFMLTFTKLRERSLDAPAFKIVETTQAMILRNR